MSVVHRRGRQEYTKGPNHSARFCSKVATPSMITREEHRTCGSDRCHSAAPHFRLHSGKSMARKPQMPPAYNGSDHLLPQPPFCLRRASVCALARNGKDSGLERVAALSSDWNEFAAAYISRLPSSRIECEGAAHRRASTLSFMISCSEGGSANTAAEIMIHTIIVSGADWIPTEFCLRSSRSW